MSAKEENLPIDSPINTPATAQLIADHYQKTFETTFDLWQQRNRLFLILLGVLGLGAVLSLPSADAQFVFVKWVASKLAITDLAEKEALRNSFPFGLLQFSFLLLVFFLVVNLYHRAVYVLRNYQYLSALEDDIRRAAGFDASPFKWTAFTREGRFYSENRVFLSSSVKWSYTVMLGAMLVAFLGFRCYDDWTHHRIVVIIVDIIVSIPTMLYYFAHVITTTGFNKYFAPNSGKTSVDGNPSAKEL